MNKLQAKKAVIIVPIICIPTFIFIVLGGMLIHSIITSDIQTRMFSSIDDFSKLEQYEVGGIDKMNDSLSVTNLDYEVIESYEKRISYNGQEYDVYAYVFENADDCYSYYEWIAQPGFNEEPQSWNYCLMSGVTTTDGQYCEFIIYSGTCLYYIIGEDEEAMIEFLNWMNSDFEISLEQDYTILG